MPGKLNAGGGLDRSDPQRTSKRGEADSRAEPPGSGASAMPAKNKRGLAGWSEATKRKIWLLR